MDEASTSTTQNMEDNDDRSLKQSLAKDHVVLEIRPANEALAFSIKEKMETISSSRRICRVPRELSVENEKAYVPGLVSIGPFHHGKEELRDMENHKWRYLHALLNRKPNLETRLDGMVKEFSKLEHITRKSYGENINLTSNEFVEARLDGLVKEVRELEHRTRKWYGENINLTSNEFVEMMLVDGCFIIELFLKYSFKGIKRRDDPVFSIYGRLFNLRLDLVLLENQIPFFILQRLFDLVPIPTQCTFSLTELAFRFFKNIIPGDKHVFLEKFSQEGHHLLDLIHNCLLPTIPKKDPKQFGPKQGLDCARKLEKTGVKVKKTAAQSLLNIKFAKGIMVIPPLRVHHYTEILLRNLIAMEQCYSESALYVTSYAFLMDSLICSEKDVGLLNRRRILSNSFDSDKEVFLMFKKLCKGTDFGSREFYYEGLCEEVKGYKRFSWPVGWRKLKTKAPLSAMAILVGVVLIFLTVVGTLFSVLAFSRRHS